MALVQPGATAQAMSSASAVSADDSLTAFSDAVAHSGFGGRTSPYSAASVDPEQADEDLVSCRMSGAADDISDLAAINSVPNEVVPAELEYDGPAAEQLHRISMDPHKGELHACAASAGTICTSTTMSCSGL